MKQHQSLLVIVLLLSIFFVNYYLAIQSDEEVSGPVIASDCQLMRESCEILLEGKVVRLSKLPSIVPLKPFTVSIEDRSEILMSADLQFEMVDMAMGENKTVFKKQNQEWIAVAVIPICVTGRRDWVLTFYLTGRTVKQKIAFKVTI